MFLGNGKSPHYGIIPYYENKNLLHKVNGMESVENVAENIYEILMKVNI